MFTRMTKAEFSALDFQCSATTRLGARCLNSILHGQIHIPDRDEVLVHDGDLALLQAGVCTVHEAKHSGR